VDKVRLRRLKMSDERPKLEPEEPSVDARIRCLGTWPSRWMIEDGDRTIRISRSTVIPWHRRLGRYEVSSEFGSLDAKVCRRGPGMKGEFEGGPDLWYSSTGHMAAPDSFLTLNGGRFGVGKEVFAWTPLPHKAQLVISTPEGKEILLASSPWQDSETGVDWIVQWIDRPEDPRIWLAVLMAPWVANRIATIEQSG
jgi:hypothetical protein